MVKQSIVKPTMVKVGNDWVKTYKDVPKIVNSWKKINNMIDDVFNNVMSDHAILHKPLNLSNWSDILY